MHRIKWINTFRTLPHIPPHSRTKEPQNARWRNKRAVCMAKQGQNGSWLLSEGREENVHKTALAKQMGTCLTSSICLLLTVGEMGVFLCPFSCCSSFCQCLVPARVPPRAPAGLSGCLISDQNQARQSKLEKHKRCQKTSNFQNSLLN